MLSYQHAYHAGNSADVLKHFVLFLVLKSLLKKTTPFHFYDSHAGAGLYDLESAESQKTKEAQSGIEKVHFIANKTPADVPDAVKNWLASLIEIQNNLNQPNRYPGSPHWALHLMREQDKSTLLELHPTEYQKLSLWQGREKRIKTFKEDSFKYLKAHLPPKENRGLVLIDPSYELTSDYVGVGTLLKDCLKRFAHGVYLIWYPVVERGADQLLLKTIEELQIPKTLWVEISLRQDWSGLGIYATGMIILNCPWQIDEQLASSLPWLTNALAQDQKFSLKWLVN